MAVSDFPSLIHSPKDRPREFSYYTDEQRAAVVYSWLVKGQDYRSMDCELLGKDQSSLGWQSMGICHYLGLREPHHGFFMGYDDEEVLESLALRCDDPEFYIIYFYLKKYITEKNGRNDYPSIARIEREFSDSEIRSKDWVINTLLRNEENDVKIDKTLLLLPDVEYQYVRRGTTYRYGVPELEESLKGLYDYRCQVCGGTVYHRGWSSDRNRKQSWRYLSSDIYYPTDPDDGGPRIKSNMVCTCPSCHRKFLSGEYRLKNNYNEIYCLDEVFGRKIDICSDKHFIDLGL